MRKIIFYIAVILCLNATFVEASFRTDIGDRSGEEVFKKSVELANTLAPGQITGEVILEYKEENLRDIHTGVLIDPYTVLTCAHRQIREELKNFWFELNLKDYGKYLQPAAKSIIHPNFKLHSAENVEIKWEDNAYTIYDIPLSSLENSSFQDCVSKVSQTFTGVDLAILKLKNPLPQNLAYLEFLDKNEQITDNYGISIGLGTLRYNMPESPPVLVSKDPAISNLKHVISCKVSSGQISDKTKILYGHYKGFLMNGDESFIPNSTMMKTEGLPVVGDSGGPLFIKIKDTYKLAGICSATYTFWHNPVVDQGIREALKGIVQPLFPTWIDVRPHIDWIQSHMGPVKS